MAPEDIAGGLTICRKVGWNQLSRDWELFLHISPDGCRVAVDQSANIIGTVTTIRYHDHFSWIGMLLVEPDWQGMGIGKNLLTQAIQMLSNEQTVKLDATPAGREVYLKSKFVDEYSISRMIANKIQGDPIPSNARLINESDFLKILKMDTKAFGADRSAILDWMWKGAKQFAYLVEHNNEIAGYCFGRLGHLYTHIGPLFAENYDVAQQLASCVLSNIQIRPIILDVPKNKPDWLNWLHSLGFSESRSLTCMYKGVNAWPGVLKKQFAILGPEFG